MTVIKTYSSRCSRSPRIHRRTQNFMSCYSALSASTVSMTNQNQNDGSIANSLTRVCGIRSNLRRFHTGGLLLELKLPAEALNENVDRLYYMYANMTSLNSWRRDRGFSESLISAYHEPTHAFPPRHVRSPSTLRRSRRPGSSHVSVSDVSFHLAWNPPAQSACITVSVLSKADRHRYEPSQQ